MNVVDDIKNGVLDCNNQESFFGTLLKGLLIDLKKYIKIRNTPVPHMILHTGDEQMYLENKGQNFGIEPGEVSNEDYIYNIVPRCVVNPSGVSVDVAQITSPYARGLLQIEKDDNLYTLSGEVRRMPITLNVDLKYLVDTYGDMLELMQQIVTKFMFVKTFDIVYLGQTIKCSYKIPESLDAENIMELDGTLQESRNRTLSLQLEVLSNIPIYNERSIENMDTLITNCKPPKKNNAYTIKI